jgi:hypothetical protein
MGVILGVSVLLDAFLVRLTLVPVFLRLAGRAAWYMPAWLRRLLPEVHFGHGGSAEVLAVEPEGDVVRDAGPGQLGEAAGVEHEQVGAGVSGVEHDR